MVVNHFCQIRVLWIDGVCVRSGGPVEAHSQMTHQAWSRHSFRLMAAWNDCMRLLHEQVGRKLHRPLINAATEDAHEANPPNPPLPPPPPFRLFQWGCREWVHSCLMWLTPLHNCAMYTSFHLILQRFKIWIAVDRCGDDTNHSQLKCMETLIKRARHSRLPCATPSKIQYIQNTPCLYRTTLNYI